MSFSIGDKVKLKEVLPNGPTEMVIENIENTEISVYWFGKDGSKIKDKFNEVLLEPYFVEDIEDTSIPGFFDDGNDLDEEHNGGSYRF